MEYAGILTDQGQPPDISNMDLNEYKRDGPYQKSTYVSYDVYGWLCMREHGWLKGLGVVGGQEIAGDGKMNNNL